MPDGESALTRFRSIRPTHLVALALIADAVAIVFCLTAAPSLHKDGHGVQRPGFGRMDIVRSWAGGHETPWTLVGFVCAFEPMDRVLGALLLVTVILFGVLVVATMRSRPNSRLSRIPWPPPMRLSIAASLVIVAVVALDLAWEVNSWRVWPARLRYVEKSDMARSRARNARDAARWSREIVSKHEAELRDPHLPDGVSHRRRESYLAGFRADAVNMKRRARELDAEADYYERMARKYELAATDARASVQPDPPPPEHELFGWEWMDRKDYRRALDWFEAQIREYPDWRLAQERRAWILATAPDARLRNGKAAVESATRACELDDCEADVEMMMTVAAAYAESGDFATAVKWQIKAVAVAKAARRNFGFAKDRLADYQVGKPYRSPK